MQKVIEIEKEDIINSLKKKAEIMSGELMADTIIRIKEK